MIHYGDLLRMFFELCVISGIFSSCHPSQQQARLLFATTDRLNSLGSAEMDVRIGLDYIVENREYVEKLGTALDTTNVTVKKQVFELLSALCAYSTEGYDRALETLEHYKVSHYITPSFGNWRSGGNKNKTAATSSVLRNIGRRTRHAIAQSVQTAKTFLPCESTSHSRTCSTLRFYYFSHFALLISNSLLFIRDDNRDNIWRRTIVKCEFLFP